MTSVEKLKSERNSNHELLRIIAMYMIIFIHANINLGIFIHDDSYNWINGAAVGICNVGVSLFVLISGYYGIKFNLKKLVTLECRMITYSLIEFGIIYAVFGAEMSKGELFEQLVKSLLPFISRKYWFYSSYVCLIIFSGFIQKLIDVMDKKTFRTLILAMLVVFSVFPTVFYFEIIPDNGKGVVQMLMVYLIGRYIRKYADLKRLADKKGILLLVMVVLWGLNSVSMMFPIRIGGIFHTICKDNSITNISLAVIIFMLFSFMEFKSKVINWSTKYLFAVFALEYNLVNVVMHYVGDWAGNYTVTVPFIVGLGMIMGIVLGVLVACILIGAIRELILGKVDGLIAGLADGLFHRVTDEKRG